MTLKERSEARRKRIVGNHARNFAEAEQWDLEFWQKRSPQERLAAHAAMVEAVDRICRNGIRRK